MRPSRSRRSCTLATLLCLAACGPPEDAQVPASRAAEQAPLPELIETSRFEEERNRTDDARLEAGAEALADRAAALRARAGLLAAPVVGDAERARLDAAAQARRDVPEGL